MRRPALILAALLAMSCTAPTTPSLLPVSEETTTPTETPAEPETPVAAPTAPADPDPVPTPKEEPPMLKPLPIYPAYILDQCHALWGIPADLEGEMQKVKINVETAEGIPVPQSELDFYALDGALYLVHSRTLEDGKTALDTYKQIDGKIAYVESAPTKPTEARATLDSPQWLIETVVVNGQERSDIYSRNDGLSAMYGNPTAKGHGPITRSKVTGYAVLDNGLLYMTQSGAEFLPSNRMSVNPVSEYGRLYRAN